MTRVFDEVRQDTRFGLRALSRRPWLCLTIIAILGLATGFTAAIFSVVNGVLLRPLPFAEPERLIHISPRETPGKSLVITRGNLEAFRSGVQSVDLFSTYSPGTSYLQTPAGTERVNSVEADRDFFGLLGVAPIAGRTFDRTDSSQVAVISERMWDRMFERRLDAIGRTLAIDGTSFVVVGVMPRRFQFPYGAASVIGGASAESQTEVWLAEYRPTTPQRRIGSLAGRLRPGVLPEVAAAELSSVVDVDVRLLQDEVLGPVRKALWLLFAAVGLVLAAACANVANLLLAVAGARMQEVATRAALGASRARLMRQFLVESLLLSIGGAIAGLAVARWVLNVLILFGAERIPRAYEISFDWPIFVFAAFMCACTAVLTSLAPALSASAVSAPAGVESGTARTTMNLASTRLRDRLVIAEIAVTFVLAFAAAGVMRDMSRLQEIDSGLMPDGVTTFHLGQRLLPGVEHQYYEIAERVGATAGVNAAGVIQVLPLQNWGWSSNSAAFTVLGGPPSTRPAFSIELRYVTPDYFEAMGIPIRTGRNLTSADDRNAPRVILINETLARTYFGDRNPLGIRTNRGAIVGIVADVRQMNLAAPPAPEIYFPIAQNWSQLGDLGMTLVVRSRLPPAELTEHVRAAVRDVNAGMVIFNIRTMDEVITDSLWNLNLYRWLIGLFAGLTLALAATGLYGVISYLVTAKQREWAIRLALGSRPIDLVKLVLARGLRLAGCGILAGLVLTALILVVSPDLPISLSPDLSLLLVIGAVIMTVTALASLMPAVRASRVAPVLSLKE